MEEVYDVVVAGGGISGTMAAIAAARLGSKTLLVERYGALGGMATLGLVQPISTWGLAGRYVIEGTGLKILQNLAERCPKSVLAMDDYFSIPPGKGPYGFSCDAEYLKLELETLIQEAGVHLLYHAWIHGVRMEEGRITALEAFSKDGNFPLRGKVFVDATGDGDVCAFAGVPFETSSTSLGQQGISLMFLVSRVNRGACPELPVIREIWERHRINKRGLCLFWHPREGSCYINMTEASGLDGLKAADLTRATLACRKEAWDILAFFREHVPGFDDAYIAQTAPALGVRETRRIVGRYILTRKDVDSGRDFEDVVVRAACPVDIHSRGKASREYYWLEKIYGIPYRTLINEAVPNVIATGRCISADQAAHSSLRRMAPGFALGEAAGIAAHLALEEGGDAGAIAVSELQAHLKALGVLTH